MRIPGIWRFQRLKERVLARRDRRVLILTYHRIAADIRSDPFELKVSSANFADHLAFLRRHYRVISLDDVAAQLERHRLNRVRAVAITFDDGYVDNVLVAAPLLRQWRAPATVYLTAAYIGTTRRFWWDDLERIVTGHKNGAMEVGNPVGKTYLLTDVRSRHQVLGDLCVRMRKMPGAERDRLLETMGSGRDSRVDDADRAMTWPEARQLREYGVAVGAHTCSHVALSAIPEDEARRDIVESKRMIENELKMELRHFSYPHDDNDYVSQQLSAASRRLAVEAGFRSGVTVVRGVNRAGQDVMALRRITVRNWDAAEFARQIERGFEGL